MFAVMVLYFTLFLTQGSLLHFAFGIGLFSYGIGRITVSVLEHQINLGLRVFIVVSSCIILALSIIIIAFPMVLVQSGPGLKRYLTFGYFLDISYILMGIDCLVSAIVTIVLKKFNTNTQR